MNNPRRFHPLLAWPLISPPHFPHFTPQNYPSSRKVISPWFACKLPGWNIHQHLLLTQKRPASYPNECFNPWFSPSWEYKVSKLVWTDVAGSWYIHEMTPAPFETEHPTVIAACLMGRWACCLSIHWSWALMVLDAVQNKFAEDD